MLTSNDYCVYVHITPSNKLYIGITCNTYKRWKANGNGYRIQRLFWRAIQKYGWDNIQHIVLLEGLSKEVACECEEYLIAKYQTTNPSFGYNVAVGGEVNRGYHLSDEQKQVHSEFMKGRYVGELNAFYGKHHTNETKLKCARAMKGKHHTKEVREQISNSLKGRPHTIEHNKKVGDALRGYVHDENYKEACRQRMLGNIPWNKGKHLSAEHIQKLKDNHVGMTGRKHSEETKQKMREAYLRRKEKENACIQ